MKQGFTLIELLVVTSIIVILSSLILFNYKRGDEQLALERASHQLSQDLRRAQEMALSSREIDGQMPGGYGLYLDENQPTQYILFADLDNENDYDAGEEIEILVLEKLVRINNLLPVNPLTIVFSPPDPQVFISGGNQAVVNLFSLVNDPAISKSISVNRVGLISTAKLIVDQCNFNSDCDDGNLCTSDWCENPADLDSVCHNDVLADGTDCGDCRECQSGICSYSCQAPVISTVADAPDPVRVGSQITFTVDWSDANPGDQTKIHICQTNAIFGQTCSEGTWCETTTWSASSPTECSYTSQDADLGTNNYYAFVCDDEDACSTSQSGRFTVEVVPASVTIFHETFPNVDYAWDGSLDTAQDEPGWVTYQGESSYDYNNVKVSNEDYYWGGSSPSGGNHLTFENADDGFQTPEIYDIAYVSIDLSGYTDVVIEYYWQSDDVDSGEGMRVAYSVDSTNGKDGTWTQIAEYLNPTDDIWFQETFNLSDDDALAAFKLRFSSKSNSLAEHMYVDDVKLTGIQE